MHHTRSQALTAAQSGAAVLNHCEVVSLLKSGTPGEAGYRITGARLKARPSINRRQLRPALVPPPVGGLNGFSRPRLVFLFSWGLAAAASEAITGKL